MMRLILTLARAIYEPLALIVKVPLFLEGLCHHMEKTIFQYKLSLSTTFI